MNEISSLNTKISISDIDYALNSSCSAETYQHNSPCYLFTTESPHIFDHLDLKSKSVLAVAAGSGDPMLQALNKGASKVDLFDISLFAKYSTELKLVALQNLGREDFCRLFNIDYINNDWNGLNIKLYNFIKKYLSDECAYLFNKTHAILRVLNGTGRYRIKELSYLSKSEEYEKIQKLAVYKPKFIWADLETLPIKLTQQYDFIYLSNIHGGIPFNNEKKINELKQIAQFLKPGGCIFVNYFYYAAQSLNISEYKNILPGYDLNTKKYDPFVTKLIDDLAVYMQKKR